MAKEKAKKGVPNKHLHARIAFLHQAATYLNAQAIGQSPNGVQGTLSVEDASHPQLIEKTIPIPPGTLGTGAKNAPANTKPSPGHPSTATFNPPSSGLPLQLNAHIRSVAQKAQIRLSSDLKHAICKVCCSPLVEGKTCLRSVENLSKGGRKPWADVLVLKCCACGASKRFPIGAKKQKRKAIREADIRTAGGVLADIPLGSSTNEVADPVDQPDTTLQMRPANP